MLSAQKTVLFWVLNSVYAVLFWVVHSVEEDPEHSAILGSVFRGCTPRRQFCSGFCIPWMQSPKDAEDLRHEVHCLKKLRGHPSVITLKHAAEDEKVSAVP